MANREGVDVANRTCTMPECGRKHIAKGLCQYHYNLKNYPGPKKYKFVETPCAHCGVVVMKQARADRANQFCSYQCRGDFQWGTNRRALVHVGTAPDHCVVPRRHPARKRPAKPGQRRFVSGRCEWCGTWFTLADQLGRYCTERCGKDAAHARRGRFRVPMKVRLSIYARDNWTCQLCMDPVDPTLEHSDPWAATLDHIECQSWALIPDHSPANLRLAHRWCNSVRGDESYYTAADLVA